MVQGEDKNKNRKWDVFHEKEVVYYSYLVNAWLQNRLDRNKQLLTISYLAIGSLLLLFPSLKDYPDAFFCTAIFWSLAFILFIMSGFLALSIMRKNADYAEAIIKKQEKKKEELATSIRKKAGWLDGLFMMGTVSIFIVILLQLESLVNKKHSEGHGMNEKSTTTSSDGKANPRSDEFQMDGMDRVREAEPKPQTPPAQATPPPTKESEK